MSATVLNDGPGGHPDLAFLVALVLFVVGAVLAAMTKAMQSVVMFAGLAALALAWLVL